MDLTDETEAYYAARAAWHDKYMSYRGNAEMEELLAPLIGFFEPFVIARDVLEIACGTGNWTQILTRRARSVVATDVNESMLAIARGKVYEGANVIFKTVDAHSLQGLDRHFTAAFAADWLSHVRKSRLRRSLEALQGKLLPGAYVVFVGMHRRDHSDLTPYRRDHEGNLIVRRELPDGRTFDVIVNFPSREELFQQVRGLGDDVRYFDHAGLARWVLAYRTV